jgi:hypothetical protein
MKQTTTYNCDPRLSPPERPVSPGPRVKVARYKQPNMANRLLSLPDDMDVFEIPQHRSASPALSVADSYASSDAESDRPGRRKYSYKKRVKACVYWCVSHTTVALHFSPRLPNCLLSHVFSHAYLRGHSCNERAVTMGRQGLTEIVHVVKLLALELLRVKDVLLGNNLANTRTCHNLNEATVKEALHQEQTYFLL